jgi:hypothetical protein
LNKYYSIYSGAIARSKNENRQHFRPNYHRIRIDGFLKNRINPLFTSSSLLRPKKEKALGFRKITRALNKTMVAMQGFEPRTLRI